MFFAIICNNMCVLIAIAPVQPSVRPGGLLPPSALVYRSLSHNCPFPLFFFAVFATLQLLFHDGGCHTKATDPRGWPAAAPALASAASCPPIHGLPLAQLGLVCSLLDSIDAAVVRDGLDGRPLPKSMATKRCAPPHTRDAVDNPRFKAIMYSSKREESAAVVFPVYAVHEADLEAEVEHGRRGSMDQSTRTADLEAGDSGSAGGASAAGGAGAGATAGAGGSSSAGGASAAAPAAAAHLSALRPARQEAVASSYLRNCRKLLSCWLD